MFPCCCCGCQSGEKRRIGVIGTIFKLVLLYVVLVVASGTLINTGYPVAVEAGRLIQVVTLVEPATLWAQHHHWDHVAGALQTLAQGFPIGAPVPG